MNCYLLEVADEGCEGGKLKGSPSSASCRRGPRIQKLHMLFAVLLRLYDWSARSQPVSAVVPCSRVPSVPHVGV